MKSTALVPFVVLAGLASPVAAQSAADGFYTDGFAELGYFEDLSGNSDVLGYTETTLGYADARSGFGFELGVDALISGDDDEAAVYGALTYQSSFGKVAFGAPRAALDDYFANVPTVGGMATFKFDPAGLVKRSILTSSYLFGQDEVPYGLRYDGTFGATDVGASYSRLDDMDVYNLAANYKLGQTTLMGGIEHLVDSGDSETRYFLGAETRFGRISAGFLYAGNVTLTNDAAVEAFAKYKPVDQLELTATALNFDESGSSTTLYGIGADYTLNQGIYVKAGIADTFESGSDTAFNLALGLRF